MIPEPKSWVPPNFRNLSSAEQAEVFLSYFPLAMLCCLVVVIAVRMFRSPQTRRRTSGVILSKTEGHLLTDRHLVTQKCFVSLDPGVVIRQQIVMRPSDPGYVRTWYANHISRAREEVRLTLAKLSNSLMSQSPTRDDAIEAGRRSKRVAMLVWVIASAVMTIIGMAVGTAMNSVNTINTDEMAAQVEQLRDSVGAIRKVLKSQQDATVELLSIVNETVIVQNQHEEYIREAGHIQTAHTQFHDFLLQEVDPINYLTQSHLRQTATTINSLMSAQVPFYLVSPQTIAEALKSVHNLAVGDIQIQTAMEMGAAISLYVDLEHRHIAFMLSLPVVHPDHIYSVKKVHNVGTWKGSLHVKTQTPTVLAYHENQPDQYFVPCLESCEKFRQDSYLCEGRPFLPDVEDLLCGITNTEAKQHLCRLEVSQTEEKSFSTAVAQTGKQWLVSIKNTVMKVSFPAQGTTQTRPVPYRVSLIKVPPNLVVTVGDQTLFHISQDQKPVQFELIHVIPDVEIPLGEDLEYLIDRKGNQSAQFLVTRNSLQIAESLLSVEDERLLQERNVVNHQTNLTILLWVLTGIWLLSLTIYTIVYQRMKLPQIIYRTAATLQYQTLSRGNRELIAIE